MRSMLSMLSAFLLTLSSFSAASRPEFSIAGFSRHATASAAQSAQVFERSGNLKQDVLDWVEYLPRDQNLYRIPAQGELDVWRQVINAIQSG
ncbi:MAG TPA: hypothetical protein VNI02_08335, partial [Blastocatellia bacterium]|nr:hypothetical protein [Blastocatellia bacterium]